jgi:hypothetical protein
VLSTGTPFGQISVTLRDCLWWASISGEAVLVGPTERWAGTKRFLSFLHTVFPFLIFFHDSGVQSAHTAQGAREKDGRGGARA